MCVFPSLEFFWICNTFQSCFEFKVILLLQDRTVLFKILNVNNWRILLVTVLQFQLRCYMVLYDIELFSWKITSNKDHLELCLANRRLLSGLFGMWSSMKITLCYAICCKWKTSSFVLIKSNMLCTMFRKQLSTHLPPLPGLVISQVVHIDLIWLTKQNIIRDPGKYPRMIETIPNWSSSPETFCKINIKLPCMCKKGVPEIIDR